MQIKSLPADLAQRGLLPAGQPDNPGTPCGDHPGAGRHRGGQLAWHGLRHRMGAVRGVQDGHPGGCLVAAEVGGEGDPVAGAAAGVEVGQGDPGGQRSHRPGVRIHCVGQAAAVHSGAGVVSVPGSYHRDDEPPVACQALLADPALVGGAARPQRSQAMPPPAVRRTCGVQVPAKGVTRACDDLIPRGNVSGGWP